MHNHVKIIGLPIQCSPLSKVPRQLFQSFRQAIQEGIVIVLPAGNYGPVIDTMNPISRIDKSIVVGSTCENGTVVCKFSSRGVPWLSRSGPSFVCPGNDVIGITHSGITPVINNQSELKHLLTKKRYERQHNTEVSDRNWEHLRKRLVVGTGTSQSVEYMTSVISNLVSRRSQLGYYTDSRCIRILLKYIARPIQNYEQFVVGNGYVDMYALNEYLSNITTKVMCSEEKTFWSGKYIKTSRENVRTTIYWGDNTSMPDKIDFTDDQTK